MGISKDAVGSQDGVFGTYVTLIIRPYRCPSTRVIVDGGPNDASLSFSFFF